MDQTQQKQSLAIVLCDDHSHGQLEKILKERCAAKTVAVHNCWQAVLPDGDVQPAVTHCVAVMVMSALRAETMAQAVRGIKTLLAHGCKAGMVLVEPFDFEEAGKALETRLLEQLKGSTLDFVDTRKMDDYAKAGGQSQAFAEFFDAVYSDIAATTQKAVADNWN